MRKARFFVTYIGIQILIAFLIKPYAQLPLSNSTKTNSQFPLVDRISSNFITSFAEDDKGYIWIGTNHGLNRFNGSNYAVFYSQEDSLSLNSDYVSNLIFDDEHRLWMSNECGLCVRENNRFRHLQTVGFNPIGRVLNLDKNSLIITDRKGIAKVNKQTLKEEKYFLKEGISVIPTITISSEKEIWSANKQMQAHNIYIMDENLNLLQTLQCPPDINIQNIVEDNQKRMWVITDKELICYHVKTKKRMEIPAEITQLTHNRKVHFLLPYRKDHLFIGIQDEGMYSYDGQQLTLIHAQQKLRKNTYICFIDSKEGIWLSDQENDFFYYPAQSTHNHLSMLSETLKDIFIKNLVFDQEGYLWMRSSKDIASYDTKSEQIIFHRSTDNAFGYIFIDSRNDLWLINNFFEVQQYTLRQGIPQLKNTITFPSNVFSISEDKQGRIWATLSDRFAILSPDGSFVYKYAPDGISFSQLQTLPSTQDMFLFTLTHGIYKFGVDQQFVPIDNLHLPNPNSIIIDRKGDYWIGTYNTGLIHYDPRTKKSERFDTSMGLIDNNIKSIIEDKNGNIWFSTSTHITQYIPQTHTYTSISDKGFSKGKLYAINCVASAPDGSLYFGGSGGITVIHPNMPLTEATDSPLNFDVILVNGKVYTGSYEQGLPLNYSENMITFWYSALNFEYGPSLNYSYKLEGFDKQWIDAGNNKRASYSNLPAGDYTFKVKVRQLNDKWDTHELKMNVHIQPAPWATTWAIISYWILGIIFTGGLIWLIVRRKVQEERLTLAERQRELNQERIDFVTNISHEIRTPLTLIYAPLKELVHNSQLDNYSHQLLQIMQRNAERLLQLTWQIVDPSQSELEEKKLHVSPGAPGAFVCSLAENFRFIAHQKNISLDTQIKGTTDSGCFDAEKIEKIVYNLLSNAVKYTPEGGHIDVITETDAEHIRIEVKDSGTGIPPEKQKELFKRFKRLGSRTNTTGSGIGLHYAQQLAYLHRGHITYKNNTPQGSCFIVEVPASRNAYHDNEFTTESTFVTAPLPTASDGQTNPTKEKEYSLLLVEDNADVRNYLQVLLGNSYNIMTANDGEEALECLSLNIPDLIVSDIVMPHKDGYEMCHAIKSSTDWGHIPVILLTAKNDTDSRIRGLDCGADAYVGKPFDPFYLKAVIENLLGNRRRIQQIIQNLTSGSIPKEKAHEAMLNEHDRIFLEDLHRRMDQHLDDEEFSIALLAKEMGMSYSSLYARIKSLTGQTPQNFLITYRMNMAMQLLRTGQYTVSEVCYKVGSSSLANFSRSFKRQFGIPPSEA